jgi:hypothetical protein
MASGSLEDGQISRRTVGHPVSITGLPLNPGDTFVTGDFDPSEGLETVIGPATGFRLKIVLPNSVVRLKPFAGLDDSYTSGLPRCRR